LYYAQGYGNHAADFVNRYREAVVKEGVEVVHANTNTEMARMDAANYNKVRSFFIEDASYLRLRNIQIGYTLPKTIVEKLKIERLRIYAGAKNLFTLTNYSGFNPEIGGRDATQMGIDYGVYPPTRSFVFGVNLQF
jgi:hypothetical protein